MMCPGGLQAAWAHHPFIKKGTHKDNLSVEENWPLWMPLSEGHQLAHLW
jgi:hypothetical protein